ncbi:hypothetical protein STCU_10845 [Strigomonas culicis]|uniref:Uncharacterized protein n=1 Tax=Strigomonas culicis TaxID=28005 RepID=S9TL54_9TRYP|nr:hypothetical protein STCU_10845 [Strigomonas culicis]|eukprot:EPY17058.1 hypothetical protein STCU_10845 [Strigomonas culicis]
MLPQRDRVAISASPLFKELHAKAALWASLQDLHHLGATVRPEEQQRYCYSAAAGQVRPLSATTQAWVKANLRDLDLSLLETGSIWFNLSQLDDAARFEPYYQNRDYFTPRSWSGRRYSPAYAFLLREYCVQYGFPLDNKYVVFVPLGRIRAQGGTVLEVPRDTPTGPVIPPPFTLIVGDDSIVSVFNALQTDISDILIQKAEEGRRDLAQKYGFSKKPVFDYSAMDE